MTERFRKEFRALTDDEKALCDMIKTKAEELAEIFDVLHEGGTSRYKSLAMTALEEAVMWAIKDVTA